jgi:Ni/Fe-hydrogenase subunit HybB-like protein
VGVVLAWGVYAMLLCWFKGLNQTNMNDYYGFALWIWADLAVIALGGGAFFTGLLKYIIGKDELKHIINFAVLIGFICYSSALLILAIDIGQPLRGWFIFWHANVHSMLTEVAFCLSCYFAVLTIEYIPLILENRQIDKVPFFHNLSHNMHGAMAVFAATGAFLSFFTRDLWAVWPAFCSAGPLLIGAHSYLALDLFPLHLVGGGLRTLLYPAHHLAHRKSDQEKTGQGQRHYLLAKISGWMISHLHHCQNHRYAILGQYHGTGTGPDPGRFLYRQRLLRLLDPFCRDCPVRCVPGHHPDHADRCENPHVRVTAIHPGCYRRLPQPLGHGAPGHGRAHHAF